MPSSYAQPTDSVKSPAYDRAEAQAKLQADRVASAMWQAGDMIFQPIEDLPGEWVVVHTFMETKTREKTTVYQVSLTECECLDFAYRCLGRGLKCKHICRLEAMLDVRASEYRAPLTPEQRLAVLAMLESS